MPATAGDEEGDRRIGRIVFSCMVVFFSFCFWMMHISRDPVEVQREARRRQPLTSLASGQSFPFNPIRDKARPACGYTVEGVEECPAGIPPEEIPRVVIRLKMLSAATAIQGAEAAKAEMRAAARQKRYCAFQVFIAATDKTDIAGDPWMMASFECGPDGRWDAARSGYPRPDYAKYEMTYHSLADSRLLPSGGR